jgi:RNA polymerase sigma factor (sigma-70 family)
MEECVIQHFADLKRRKCSAWTACRPAFLRAAHRTLHRFDGLSPKSKRDIEHEAVITLYLAIDRVEKPIPSPGNAIAFVKGAARNLAMKETQRLQRLSPVEVTTRDGETHEDLWDQDDPSVFAVKSEDEQDAETRKLSLQEALEELGSPCREYLLLRYGDKKLTGREIGENYGVEGSVMLNRIKSCEKKLKKIYEKKLGTLEDHLV